MIKTKQNSDVHGTRISPETPLISCQSCSNKEFISQLLCKQRAYHFPPLLPLGRHRVLFYRLEELGSDPWNGWAWIPLPLRKLSSSSEIFIIALHVVSSSQPSAGSTVSAPGLQTRAVPFCFLFAQVLLIMCIATIPRCQGQDRGFIRLGSSPH